MGRCAVSQPITDDFEGVIYVAGKTVRYWRDRGPNPDVSDMTRTERMVAIARLRGVLDELYLAIAETDDTG